MNKFICLPLLFLLVCFHAFAQVLTLSNADHPEVPNGSTVNVPGEPSDEDVMIKMYITNNDSIDLNVKVRKAYIQIVDGSTNSFCWGACFQNDVWESPFPVCIGAGETDIISFAGHYHPNDYEGISIIAYTFFSVGREDDDTVMFKAAYMDNSTDNTVFGNIDDHFSAPYPNPAKYHTTFQYSFSSVSECSICIYDITGKPAFIKDITDNSGEITIDTGELKNGVYIYRIIKEGACIMTGRLTICR